MEFENVCYNKKRNKGGMTSQGGEDTTNLKKGNWKILNIYCVFFKIIAIVQSLHELFKKKTL